MIVENHGRERLPILHFEATSSELHATICLSLQLTEDLTLDGIDLFSSMRLQTKALLRKDGDFLTDYIFSQLL